MPKEKVTKTKSKTKAKTNEIEAEASAKIGNINIHIETDHEEKKRKPKTRTKIIKEMVPTPVYPKPNYASSQLSNHKVNQNSHFADNAALSDYTSPAQVVNNIEGPNYYNNPEFKPEFVNNNDPVNNNNSNTKEQQKEVVQTEKQVKPETEASKSLTVDDMKKVLGENEIKDFAMNTVANTAGTVAGVAGLAGAQHVYNKGLTSTLKDIGSTATNLVTGVITKGKKVMLRQSTRPSRTSRLTQSMGRNRPDGYSLLTGASPQESSSAVSNSSSFQAYRDRLNGAIEGNIKRRNTVETSRIEPNNRLTTFGSMMKPVQRQPDLVSSSPAYNLNTNLVETFGPHVNRTPTRRAQSAPIQTSALSPIVQAPTTQVQNRVRPTPRRINLSTTNHGLLTPSQDFTRNTHSIYPTPGSSPFIRPTPRRSTQNIISEIQPAFQTPKNTEFVNTRRGNNNKAAASNSRAGTPGSRAGTPGVASSNSINDSIHLLSGGMLGSARNHPSKAPRYIQGYNDRRATNLKGEKAKAWTAETNMQSPFAQGYYGNRNDSTIERYIDRTPPPRTHGNSKKNQTKKDKDK